MRRRRTERGERSDRERVRKGPEGDEEERSKASVQRQCATSNHRLSRFPPPVSDRHYHCYSAPFHHRLLHLPAALCPRFNDNVFH